MPRRKKPPAPASTQSGPIETIEQAPTDALATAMQSQLLTVLQGVQALAERQPTDSKDAYARHLKALQEALRFLHKEHPTGAIDDAPAIDPEQLHQFSQALRQARKVADLTQQDVADRAGLSVATIKSIEQARHNPTAGTLRSLLGVAELAIEADSLPNHQRRLADFRSLPNCWIAPGYDPIKMFTDHLDLVNSHGGSIEQTYAYLDHRSAAHWYNLSNLGAYAASFRANMPLDAMARRILECTGRAGLDILALGAGDGKQEVRLDATSARSAGQRQPGSFVRCASVSARCEPAASRGSVQARRGDSRSTGWVIYLRGARQLSSSAAVLAVSPRARA